MLDLVTDSPEHRYLSRCMDAFMVHLDRGTFEEHMDEWTVFGGEPPRDPLGFYKSYSDALNAGYASFKLESFMVQQITIGHKIFGRWGAPIIATGLLADILRDNTRGSLTPLIPKEDKYP